MASRHAYCVNSTLSSIALASFPCAYSTAENMLTRTAVDQRDRVLVTGASGGVGSAAVQLAKARGAEVVAQTSRTKLKQLGAIGADGVVARDDSLIERFGANSFDVVIDLVAGPSWVMLPDLLRPFGRYAVAGAIGGPVVELDVRTLYLKDLQFFGCTVLEAGVFAKVIKRIEANDIASLVANTFALSEIKQAQQAFEFKDHVGKIVLDVPR